MKTCPQCRAQYDDYMRFCLQDGTPLVGKSSKSPTENATEKETEEWNNTNASTEIFKDQNSVTKPFSAVQTQNQTETQRNGSGNLIGAFLIGGLLLLVSAIGGAMWYLNHQKPDEIVSANTNKGNAVNLDNQNTNSNTAVSNDNSSESSNQSEINAPTTIRTNSNLKPSPTLTPKPTATSKPEEIKTPSPKPISNDLNSTPVRNSKPIAGGVVNGRAISLPKPNYPPAAKSANVKGAVNVQVLIDEDGNVIRARAIGGHPLLRSAAENVARRAKFRPTELSGQPVRVSGVIVYVFN